MNSSVIRRTGPAAAALGGLLVAATPFLGAGVQPARADRREVSAHIARTLNGRDTAHLRVVHVSGAVLLEEGSASGGLPGHMRAELHVGTVFTGRFTFYTSKGDISGYGRANPHGEGRYQSFAGSLTVSGGSGMYRHVHGRAGLYGTFDRRTYAVLIQTTGTLSYD